MSTVALKVQAKLEFIAGTGKLHSKIAEARGHLAKINSQRWRSPQAPGRIKRFLYGEQKPEFEEVDDIREAFDKLLDEKLALAKRITSQLEYARATDADFHGPTIKHLVGLLEQLRPFLHDRQ